MPTLSFVFCMELCQGNALGQAQFNLQRLVGNSEIDCSFFPKTLSFLVSVTLFGLVKISKTRYRKEDLFLLPLLRKKLICFNYKLKGSREENIQSLI